MLPELQLKAGEGTGHNLINDQTELTDGKQSLPPTPIRHLKYQGRLQMGITWVSIRLDSFNRSLPLFPCSPLILEVIITFVAIISVVATRLDLARLPKRMK
uniref:SFRICE_031604 n=1 Tax=Spodoptera frugiperda TaxID=7108 RepID=A0A2H1VS41_SPOFR